MKPQEIQEQLQDSQEALVKMGEQLKDGQDVIIKIDERVNLLENKLPVDYKEQFAEIKDQIKAYQLQVGALIDNFGKCLYAIAGIESTLKELFESQKKQLKEWPEQLKVVHRFEDKTKWRFIGGAILFLFSSVLIGVSLYLLSENGRMKDNDVKFRMVRQGFPATAYRIDTLYNSNPDFMEKQTKQLEAQQTAIAEAEAATKQISEEAKEAKRKANKLKKDRRSLRK